MTKKGRKRIGGQIPTPQCKWRHWGRVHALTPWFLNNTSSEKTRVTGSIRQSPTVNSFISSLKTRLFKIA